ncbi:Uncharacterised protein [marine metagenome]
MRPSPSASYNWEGCRAQNPESALAQFCALIPGKITPQGRSVSLPQSSAFMKLAKRPNIRPVGAEIAIMSAICGIGILYLRQNINPATITPRKPP